MLIIDYFWPNRVVLLVIIYLVTSQQDTSVIPAQIYGQMSPPAASVLLASSSAFPLSAPRAKSVLLKEMAPVGVTPLGCALYTVTQTAALLMECCSASWPPAPMYWLRPAQPPETCPCSVWKWSTSRTATLLCRLSSRSLWTWGTRGCPCWKGRHNGPWWDTLYGRPLGLESAAVTNANSTKSKQKYISSAFKDSMCFYSSKGRQCFADQAILKHLIYILYLKPFFL